MFLSNVTVRLQVEKFLSGRLEAGLKSWTECLKGSRTSRHMTMDDSDTSMMAHKPGGDPDIQVIIRLILLWNYTVHNFLLEAAWPSGQLVGLWIRQSWVWIPLWSLAGFVLGCPNFKSLATLVYNQLVTANQLGFVILWCCFWIIYLFLSIWVDCL